MRHQTVSTEQYNGVSLTVRFGSLFKQTNKCLSYLQNKVHLVCSLLKEKRLAQ